MASTTAAPPASHAQGSYPLTPLQQGMLAQALRAPGAGVDIEQVVCRLRETVDAGRLEGAWRAVVRRHGILRTRVRWADVPDLVQEVLPDVPLDLVRHDCGGLEPAAAEARLARWLAEDRARGFDLARAPAMRLALFRLADDAHVLVWTVHHLLLDGRSVTHVLHEAFTLYDAGTDATEAALPARRPFGEHVAWLRGRDPAADEAYWTALLRGMDAPEPLRACRRAPRDPAAEPAHGVREVRLTEPATAALRALEARGCG